MWYESALTQRLNWCFQNMAVTTVTSYTRKEKILPVFSRGRKQTPMRPWPHPRSCNRIRTKKLTIVTSKRFWVGAGTIGTTQRQDQQLKLGILWGQSLKGRECWLWMAHWAGLIALLCCLATWKLFSLLFQLKVAYLSPMMLIYSRSKIRGKK